MSTVDGQWPKPHQRRVIRMESEAATRHLRIDPRLNAAGWKVVPSASLPTATGDPVAIEEFATPIGPADYALFDGGRCLGVAEAKKLTLGPQDDLALAGLRYALTLPTGLNTLKEQHARQLISELETKSESAEAS
jgi:predicted type IV restriction endonuclease